MTAPTALTRAPAPLRKAVLARPFKGVISAPFMPMQGDGEIDWISLRHYMRWIADQNPSAIAVNMDAAEAPALSNAERVEVMRVCAEVVAGRVPLVCGLIGGATDQMIAHGRDLVAAGAEGFCVFPPFPVFMGAPIPPEMIRRFHADIADALGLPLIAFQFPRGWGPDYSGEMLDALASIPQVIAIKESSFDANQTIQSVQSVKALPDPIGILTGSDTFIYEAILMGCDGALIGFAGTAVAELVAMNEAVQNGDAQKGREIWERLAPVARYCWRAPIRDFRPRMKEILRLQGLIADGAVRRPQLGISANEKGALAHLARTAGLI
ncbi:MULTISPECIES: dihydrodipicolinate synthase family protein [unclassified Chelatococcus]|uniref:dihydrodipicolinate synthase family protein n=1 Tax=unclassified Chelatococcus TaxID=2638111 RepID=UPI001BCC7E03|nr:MULTISPECIES: dihydrodipicolinate synthase family protein [unclassified Chelatococcus]MBS7699979.1 dihydrodipicolinate synthase family protein [Chelatococcus sp. YT9]MBX3558596.1 dihydrodipicolinate synthase family protein [Chelatococcus sp.]